jgi:hypothetical protein
MRRNLPCLFDTSPLVYDGESGVYNGKSPDMSLIYGGQCRRRLLSEE